MVLPVDAAAKSSGKSRSYSSYKSFSKKTLIKVAPIAIAPVVAPVVATTPPATPTPTPTPTPTKAQAPTTVQTQAPTKAPAPTPTTVQAPRTANTNTVTQLANQPQVANPYLDNRAAGTNYGTRGHYSSFNKGYNTSRMATTRHVGDYDDDDCMSSFYQSQTPVVLNNKLNADAVFLCF